MENIIGNKLEDKKLSNRIYGTAHAGFDEHFQQDHLKFTFEDWSIEKQQEGLDEGDENFGSVFLLANDIKNIIGDKEIEEYKIENNGEELTMRDLEDRGIFFEIRYAYHKIKVIVRTYNDSREEFEAYLEKNGIEEDPWPNSPTHVFYSWKDLWEEFDNHNNINEEEEDEKSASE